MRYALPQFTFMLRISGQLGILACLIGFSGCTNREKNQNVGPPQAFQCFLPVHGIREPNNAQRAGYLSDGRVLVNAGGQVYVLQPRAQAFEPVDIPPPAAPLTGWKSMELSDHRVFLWSNNSAYILPVGSSKAAPAAPTPFSGQISNVQSSRDGTVVFNTHDGLYVLPTGASSVKQVGGLPANGSLFAMRTLSNGDIMNRPGILRGALV